MTDNYDTSNEVQGAEQHSIGAKLQKGAQQNRKQPNLNELPSDTGHPETLQPTLDERIGRTMGYWGNADLEHDWYPEHTAKIKQLINDEVVRELEEQLTALPDAVFVPDEADAITNAGGKGLAVYRHAVQKQLTTAIARRKGEKHGL